MRDDDAGGWEHKAAPAATGWYGHHGHGTDSVSITIVFDSTEREHVWNVGNELLHLR